MVAPHVRYHATQRGWQPGYRTANGNVSSGISVGCGPPKTIIPLGITLLIIAAHLLAYPIINPIVQYAHLNR